jgi:long-chain acyl-CoA synthetase
VAHALCRLAGDRPDAIVVRSDTKAVTAGELWSRIQILAKRLRELGRGVFVAYGDGDVADFLTVFVSARVAGVPVLVMPSNLRAVAHAVTETRSVVVLTSTEQTAVEWRPVLLGASVLTINAAMAAPIARPGAHPVEVPPETGAIVYTSGTTSDPLGVMVTEESFAVNVEDLSRAIPLERCASVAACVPFHTSYGLSVGLLLPLLLGKTLRTLRFTHPRHLVDQVARERDFLLLANPSVCKWLLAGDVGLKQLRERMILALSSGDVLPPSCSKKMADECGVPIIDSYGTTETNGIALRHAEAGGRMTVLDSVQVRIFDGDGKPCASGEEGQLWVRGKKNMLGYLSKPELTAAKMSDGWIRTGDIGHAGGGATWRLVGRDSAMIRVSGMRVASGQIEAALESVAGVEDALVFGVDDEQHGQVVCAQVVRSCSSSLTTRALRESLARMFPGYMIPRQIEWVETIRTAGGKKRRRPFQRLAGSAEAYE